MTPTPYNNQNRDNGQSGFPNTGIYTNPNQTSGPRAYVPPSTAAAPEMPTNTNPDLPNIRTYKSDVANVIQAQNESLVTMAIAEKKRKEEQQEQNSGEKPFPIGTIVTVLISILLIAGGGGVIGYYFYNNQKTTTPPPIVIPKSIIIFENETKISTDNWTADGARTDLIKISSENVPQGSIKKIKLTSTETGLETEARLSSSMIKAGVRADAGLLRSFDGEYMLGIFGSDSNKPFLITENSLYENAYGGMLAWEKNMVEDMANILPIIKKDEPVVVATSTKATTTTQNLIPTTETYNFSDKIIGNKDVRLAKNRKGETMLLYSFIDTKTILITRDEKTFTNILERYISSKLVK